MMTNTDTRKNGDEPVWSRRV